MPDLFVRLLLGHLAGDYLLQGRTMAIKKANSGLKGLGWCFFHCVVYTASVCLFLWTVNPLAISAVFLSHFPWDRWSLASKWLKLIRGRDFVTAYFSKEKYREIDIAFSCLVYAVVDNAMHLILLWLVFCAAGLKI